MNLFELFVKIGVDDQASGKISDLSSKLGNGLKTAAKIGAAAVGAAATGIVALTKAAVDNYAEYEQLVGGAQLMFGNAYDTVAENAQDAYKTVQMSQNEYLKQVNGFATGLKIALGGNERAAANLAHKIIQAEADIVAATGNTQENVQNAFNGIMKSNFTMLDNLQIGITPTKEGFQEVIDKVNEWNDANGRATKYQMGNLADMQSALVDYIDMVGMSGYAQREASNTITGSISSMKSAWSNLVTGLANNNADIEALMDDFVTTIVGDGTESNLGVFKNIMPAAEAALNGVGRLIDELFPLALEKIPSIVSEYLPKIVESAGTMVESFINGISDNKDEISKSAVFVVNTIINTGLKMLPDVFSLGIDLVLSLADGIAENTDELIPAATETVLDLAEYLLDNSDEIVDIGIKFIESLIEGIGDAEGLLEEKAPELVEKFVTALIRNLPKMIKMGFEMITSMNSGMSSNTGLSTETIRNIVDKIIEVIKNTDWVQLGKDILNSFTSGIKERRENTLSSIKSTINPAIEWIKDVKERAFTWGKDLISNFISGLKQKWENLKKTVSNIAQSIKDRLGFSEPKLGPLSNFHTYAPDMMDLFAKGIRDNEDVVINQVKKSFDLRKHIGTIEPEFSGVASIGSYGGYGATTTEKSVSVVQNIYSEAKSAADLMQEALYFQERSVMLGV